VAIGAVGVLVTIGVGVTETVAVGVIVTDSGVGVAAGDAGVLVMVGIGVSTGEGSRVSRVRVTILLWPEVSRALTEIVIISIPFIQLSVCDSTFVAVEKTAGTVLPFTVNVI